MYVSSVEVAPLAVNCCLLGDEASRRCVIIDPGGSQALIRQMIDRSGMAPLAILLTHGHYDHVGAVDSLLEMYPELVVYIHPADLASGAHERYRMDKKGLRQRTYGEGDTLKVGELGIKVLHTPGHSPGSVTLLAGELMLSGDTLFAGTCGRWDLPGGDGEQLLQSLAKLGRLSGDYRILPGHGEATTLSVEKKINPYMKQAMRL